MCELGSPIEGGEQVTQHVETTLDKPRRLAAAELSETTNCIEPGGTETLAAKSLKEEADSLGHAPPA